MSCSRIFLWTALIVIASVTPVSALEPPHNEDNSVSCLDCHAYRDGELVLRGVELEAMCQTCHNPTGPAASMSDVANHVVNAENINGGDIVDCGFCHDPHGPNETEDTHPGGAIADNLSLVRSDTAYHQAGALEPALFQVRPDQFGFAEGNSPYNGICQSCHTETAYHTNDGTGDNDHMIGTDCIDCHQHTDGFLPTSACNVCHGNATNAAPPLATDGSEDTTVVEVGAHQSHVIDGDLREALSCADCHVLPALLDPTHIDTAPAEVTWGALALTEGVSASWDRNAETCSDVYCHGATLAGGTLTDPSWTTVDDTQAACGTCHGNPPPATHPQMADCSLCHPDTVDAVGDIIVSGGYHVNGTVEFSINGSCDACHGAPPSTQGHLVHYGAGAEDASYGGTGITADLLPAGTAYAFDCGNCHPMDEASHVNGVNNPGGGHAEIEMTPTGAPAGSLRAMHDAGANYNYGASLITDADGFTFTQGNCENIYCHSAKTVESLDPVPEPGVDFAFAGYPITYPAYNVDEYRTYSNPTWGGSIGCDDCHGFIPQTEDPDVLAASGDSHSYINADGYEDLHGYMHGQDPCACATCHNDTITDEGTRTRVNGIAVYDPVPISDMTNHVNGQPDVAFTATPVTVINTAFDLTTATYDSATQTCSDVECHFDQTEVVWGTPFRWDNIYECNVCHQM